MNPRHHLRVTALVVVVLALLWGSGCRPSTLQGSGHNEVRAYISSDPTSLSLLGKTDKNAVILAVQIADSLVQYDSRLELRPRLAESWDLTPDRRTVTFRLRPGVRWHDGEPFTADDVVFSVNKVRETAVENTTWAPRFAELLSVEAVDPLTVRARYETATPDYLEGWTMPMLPLHLAGRDADLLTGEYSRHPVGCGPFRFVRYRPGEEIVLEANDDYWDGRPEIDRLILKIYPDQRTGYQALLSGELDIITVTSNLYDEMRRSAEAPSFTIGVQELFSVWLLGWQLDGSVPAVTDARVRRALLQALDREQFIERVMLGLGRSGITGYHPDTQWADPTLEPWPFDRAAAEALLDAAGWKDLDGDGVRERDGQRLEFELLIPASNQQLARNTAMWQQQSWAEIGVRTEITELEWKAFKERRNSGRFDILEYTLTFTPTPDHFELYHSSAREHGINYFGIDDPEIDRLTEAGRATFDDDARRRIYHELQRRLHELQPVTALFNFASPVLYDRRLEGVRLSPLGYFSTADGPRLWRWDLDDAGG